MKVIKSDKLSRKANFDDLFEDDVRYICVDDNDESKVLDDAQGYGYKSAQSAHKAFAFKNNPKNKNSKGKFKKKRVMPEEEGQMWLYAYKMFCQEFQKEPTDKELTAYFAAHKGT